jgi:hypothetical protein
MHTKATTDFPAAMSGAQDAQRRRSAASQQPKTSRLTAATACAALACFLFFGPSDFPEAVVSSLWVRGLLAGTAVGLALAGSASISQAFLVAGAASLAGLVGLFLVVAPGSVAPGAAVVSLALAAATCGLTHGAMARIPRSRPAGVVIGCAALMVAYAWTLGWFGSPLRDIVQTEPVLLEDVPTTGGTDMVLLTCVRAERAGG